MTAMVLPGLAAAPYKLLMYMFWFFFLTEAQKSMSRGFRGLAVTHML